eukprot:COSAG01_NODE_941_length_12576_cov_118.998557_10_plen_376_part_00
MSKDAKLILEDGSVFPAKVFANGNDCIAEVVFNTAMTGYQEIATDPSYKGQIVVLCYPLIGNYGCREADQQSQHYHLSGLITKQYCDTPSHFQSEASLKHVLEKQNIIGLTDLDTRKLTRYLRDKGSQMGMITCQNYSIQDAVSKIKNHPHTNSQNLSKAVSCSKVYTWSAPAQKRFDVAVLDCGVKFGILDSLKAIGAQVTVYPFDTPASTLLAAKPDGVLISNGPGNPENVPEAVSCIQALLGKVPIFGICLGHQLLALALDLPLVKLGFGHHGGNHPVLNTESKRIEISSQNHIYNIDSAAAKAKGADITHINLNDHTVAGIRVPSKLAFSVQFHPEASPGPNDSSYLFDSFAQLMTNKAAVSYHHLNHAKA